LKFAGRTTVIAIVALFLSTPFLTSRTPQGNDTSIPPVSSTSGKALHALGSVGGYFTENVGQVNGLVRYYSTGNPAVAFRDDGVMFVVGEAGNGMGKEAWRESADRFAVDETATVKSFAYMLRFEGANAVTPTAKEPLPFNSSFFIGNDSAKWRTGVRNYREIVYENLYDGVDLVYRMTGQGLKYDFILSPGRNPETIVLSYEGIDGLTRDSTGDLLIHAVVADVRDAAPVAHQGERQVGCSFILRTSHSCSLSCQNVDDSIPLVIDPLVYSTYLGGGGNDFGESIAADSAGDAYVTGFADSADFPVTPGAFEKTQNGGIDAFFVKLDATDGSLVYATYLGGDGYDAGYSIAVDSAGNAYATGETDSADFPVTSGAFDEIPNGGRDAFVVKLDATGSSLVYATFLGGSGGDWGYSIAVDSAGNAYATGDTWSANFPVTPGAFDKTLNTMGSGDAFAAKLDATGGSLVYATYLGGSGGDSGNDDYGYSIAVDSLGNAYVTGATASADFPVTPSAFDKTLGGRRDAFVVKFDVMGSSLIYSTFLGGGDWEEGYSIAVDSAGNAYVTGDTGSADFPVTPGALDRTLSGRRDAFVVKLDATGSSLVYATYLGGSGNDLGESIVADSAGDAYATGETDSADFPVTSGAFDEIPNGGRDAFVVKLDATGSSLVYATYLGGGGDDWGYSIAADSAGNAYVTGDTGSADFPVTSGAFDETLNGGRDAFVVKLVPVNSPTLSNLGVQGFTAPPGILHITDFTPDLNWTYFDPYGNPQLQHDVRVGSSPGAADMWDPPATPGSVTKVTYAGLPLVRGNDYYFAVKANDGVAWSTEVEVVFHVNSIPGAPTTPIDPAQSSIMLPSSSQTVSWTSGGDREGDAITYEWQVATDSSFTAIVASGSTTGTTSAQFSTNLPTTYYWRVRARDDYESMSWSSYGNTPPSYWTFRTNSPPTASNLGVQGCIYAPCILHITDSTPDLNWTYIDLDGNPQAWYDVRVGSAPGTADMWDPPPASGSATVVTYSGSPLVRGTDYYFGVRVNDSTEWGPEVEVMFHVNSMPAAPRTPIAPAQSSTISANATQTMTWTSGGDAEGDTITHEWQVSTDTAFTTVVASGTTTATASTSFATSPSTTYYWRVGARDDYEPAIWSDYGNTPPGYWTFSTSPPPNTPPKIAIISPAGGEVWQQRESRTVTWTASDKEDFASSLVVFINYTSSAGSGRICGPVAGNAGSCAWTLPAINATDVIVNATVVDTGGLRGYDDSGPFTIQTPPAVNTPPTVSLTSPIGGEHWGKGSTHGVTWSMHDDQDLNSNLTVYLNYTTGGVTTSIVAGLKGIESYQWALPDIVATDVVVNITVIDTGGLKGWAQSGPFEIKIPTSPPSVETNYKPFVAAVFAIILLTAGLWSSKKRPWKGGKDRMAVAKAFTILSMPFVLAEAGTGVVSLLTGQLSIPPLVEAGTVVDLSILIVGMCVVLLRARRPVSPAAIGDSDAGC